MDLSVQQPVLVFGTDQDEDTEVSDAERAVRGRLLAAMSSGKLKLPPLPRLAMELNRLANSPDPSIDEAVLLVQRDPQLAGRVLKMASSIAYGRTPVANLREASLRTGLRGLRDIAFAVSVGDMFRAGTLGKIIREVNAHSFVVARGAAHLCELQGIDKEFGFLCGLMHDVGRVTMATQFAQWGRREPQWLEVDYVRPFIDKFHPELGALVLSRWDVHVMVKQVVTHHHFPSRAGAAAPLAYTVAVANSADHLPGETADELVAGLRDLEICAEAELAEEHFAGLVEVILAARGDRLVQALGE